MAVPDTTKPATEPVNGFHSVEQLGSGLNYRVAQALRDWLLPCCRARFHCVGSLPEMNAHVSAPSDALNLTALQLDVQNAVATAKIAEFENQSYRLGHVIVTGLLGRAVVADLLLGVATANGLVHEHGDDFIQKIMAEGLNCETHQ